MLDIKNEGVILRPTKLSFESRAVLNPACIKRDGLTHMFYRAIDDKNISSIGYCQLKNNHLVKRLKKPILKPEYDYEKLGLEDPRIVCLEGIYYLFYTVFDGQNALIAYATSRNLKKFVKRGIISPQFSYDEAEDLFRDSRVKEKYIFFEDYFKKIQGRDVLLWEKDACLFPRKINGKFVLMHRILPGIQIIYFESFAELTEKFWRRYLRRLNHFVIIEPRYKHENRNIGGGCPPIETRQGWLLIYHSVEDTLRGKVYHASAALFDLNQPTKLIARLKKPLFSPEEEWETKGEVNNVVFPSGAIVKKGRLYIYYGAADSVIACRSVELNSLIRELKNQRVKR